MNFIVMDLEWNQGKLEDIQEQKRIPFEIIEIGAVKLNEQRQSIDTFQRVIKPRIYPELFPVTQSLVQIQEKELNEGGSFIEVIHEFFDWCGKDYVFCTWGNMDLVELQRNMEYYGVSDILTKAFCYYDAQKLFSLQFEGRKNPKTLEYAVEYFKIKKNKDFHRALYDAEYTAKVFQRLDETIVKTYFSIDHFHNPQDESEEVYVNFGTYSKYISREFETKEEALSDKKIRQMNCFICNRPVKKRLDWFSNNPKNYYCLGYCSEHGYLKGRIQMNKSDNGKRYVIKIISRINKEAAKSLKLHHDEIIIKKSENK